MRPVIDIEGIEAATRIGMADGHRVFQPLRRGDTDAAHVQAMLDDLDPPEGALVLDCGCGIGEVARIMSQMRPDLQFILVNISPMQLDLCPQGHAFSWILGDCHDLTLEDASVDCVMFSASLVQMDIPVALAEARRVTKPGGVLMLHEMVRTHEPIEAQWEATLGLHVPELHDLLAALVGAGWRVDFMRAVEGDDSHFRRYLADAGIEGFADAVAHMVLRARAWGGA